MSTKSNIDENIEILDFKYQLNNPKKDNSLLKNFILIRTIMNMLHLVLSLLDLFFNLRVKLLSNGCKQLTP